LNSSAAARVQVRENWPGAESDSGAGGKKSKLEYVLPMVVAGEPVLNGTTENGLVAGSRYLRFGGQP
jgi:hypothetical protein